MRSPTRFPVWILPLSLIVLGVTAGAAGLYDYSVAELSGPVQPIQFSHQSHFQTLQIPCLYCHTTADKSQHASVPAVSICMGCHQWVKKGALEGSEQEIAKLADYYQKGISIPWVRVHQLPEHVQFRHQPHVRIGLACQDCHGAVETMNRIYLVPDTRYSPSSAWLPAKKLEMGWCMDCHDQQKGTQDCVSCHY
jgi:hypothetical protein